MYCQNRSPKLTPDNSRVGKLSGTIGKNRNPDNYRFFPTRQSLPIIPDFSREARQTMESHLVESCSIFEVFPRNAKFPTFCGVSLRPVAGVIGGSFGQTGRRIDYVVLRVRDSVMLCIVFISWCCCNFALQPMLLVSAIYLCYLSHSIATSSLR
jgi:hypothetical protein